METPQDWQERRFRKAALDNWREADDAPATTSKGSLWEQLTEIFPDQTTLQVAVQYQALTAEEKDLLQLLLTNIATERLNWTAIARAAKSSRQTLKRKLSEILRRFLVEAPKRRHQRTPGCLEIVKIRSERGRRYYLVHQVALGKWQHIWRERLVDDARINRLIDEKRPVIHSTITPYRQTLMQRLFGALMTELAVKFPKPVVWPPAEFAGDWDFNVTVCGKILSELVDDGPWTAGQIYHALWKRSKKCRSCHTPVIAGLRIHRQLITRARDFCDGACRVAFNRRRKQSNHLIPR